MNRLDLALNPMLSDSMATLGRLPGVVCETRMPNLGAQPLRLDVAGFVGLAERGPLDAPVLIEDVSQYRLIFGGDLPVARVEGRPLFAHLPRAVEAFFENGGRRCYVVRVAGQGNRANLFQLPGLLQEGGDGDWQPLVVPAAWPGRWSDLVTLAASLRVLPLEIRGDPGSLSIAGSVLTADNFGLPLRLPAANALQPGDLLRLHLERAGGQRYHLTMRAGAIAEEATAGGAPLFGVPVTVSPAAGSGRLFRTNPAAFTPVSAARMSASGWAELPFAAADYRWSAPTDDRSTYRLTMPLDSAVKIDAGDLLRIRGLDAAAPMFFPAESVQRGRDPDAGDAVRLIVDSATPLQVTAGAVDEAHVLRQVDVLSFDLTVREGETASEKWQDLRFGRSVNGWRAMLQPPIDRTQVDPTAFTVDDFTSHSLRLSAPLGEDRDPLLLPLGMSALPVYHGPRDDLLPGGKDGLDVFDPAALYLDEEFAAVGVRSLMALVSERLHLAEQPLRLRGLHSLIPVDDVALISLPDLAHIGWERPVAPVMPEPEPPPIEPEPPTGFHDCPPPPLPSMRTARMMAPCRS